MIIPTFVYVWALTLCTMKLMLNCYETCIAASANEDEPMPDSVKHMYN